MHPGRGEVRPPRDRGRGRSAPPVLVAMRDRPGAICSGRSGGVLSPSRLAGSTGHATARTVPRRPILWK
ncbi:hypothetical protein KPATCC21470_7418 [Kitasatospora purpeofusca]